jgi:hypothetical protein
MGAVKATAPDAGWRARSRLRQRPGCRGRRGRRW